MNTEMFQTPMEVAVYQLHNFNISFFSSLLGGDVVSVKLDNSASGASVVALDNKIEQAMQPELIGCCSRTAVPLQSLGWGQESGRNRKQSTGLLTPPFTSSAKQGFRRFGEGCKKNRAAEPACGGVAEGRLEDLVKNHLMYAVREEVEILKEQIRELVEKNSQLERENTLLKTLASPEQLEKFQSRLSPEEPAPETSQSPEAPDGSAV
uniref:TSC22 domain family member 3 n=1 Tax=Myotis myotis TaxID=51298 RepID=A0A7J7YFW7_MYOMY|nr:TSC22 domain family member 3 [Myotis myotis]